MIISFPFLRSWEFASGSEHGWALNAARLFRALGHDVRIGSAILEGITWTLEQDFVSDVMYIPERVDLRADQTLWNQCLAKSKKFLLGVYCPLSQEWMHSVPENAIIVSPWLSCGTHSMVLPYSYYHERPQPNFAKQTLAWTTRNTFNYHGQPLPYYEWDLYHLQACQTLVDEGHKLIMFNAHSYPTVREGLPERIQYAVSIIDDLKANPRTVSANHLLYDDYINLLREASVVVPLAALGSTSEAFKVGTYALNWDTIEIFYRDFPNRVRYESLTYDIIYERLHRLLTDEGFYKQEFEMRFSRAGIYSFDEALSLVNSVLERF